MTSIIMRLKATGNKKRPIPLRLSVSRIMVNFTPAFYFLLTPIR
jgi:hypothetical protein